MLEAVVVCMALNIYHEARSEPLAGQIAVAHVVLNRTTSSKYPDDPCKVIYQRRSKRSCQFSWYCDGKSDRPKETLHYSLSEQLALDVLKGNVSDPTKGATHYHADYVTPHWAKKMKHTVTIGTHKFYK